MNALFAFFKSKDGLVTILALVLLGVVSHYSTENPWINLLARVGNLLIFIYILWRAGGRKAIAFLSGRRSGIAAELESLRHRKEEAERHLAELKGRIANVEAEREAILRESRTQAEALKAAVLAEAEDEARKIRENAGRAAESEGKLAMEALRARMADEIVAAVQTALETRLTPAQHAKLIDNSLKKVVLH